MLNKLQIEEVFICAYSDVHPVVQITQIRYLESMTITSLFILHSPNSKEHYKALEMLGGKLSCCWSKSWMPISIKDGHNYQQLKTKKSHEHKKMMNQNGTDKVHWSTTLSEFKTPLFLKEIQQQCTLQDAIFEQFKYFWNHLPSYPRFTSEFSKQVFPIKAPTRHCKPQPNQLLCMKNSMILLNQRIQ